MSPLKSGLRCYLEILWLPLGEADGPPLSYELVILWSETCSYTTDYILFCFFVFFIINDVHILYVHELGLSSKRVLA